MIARIRIGLLGSYHAGAVSRRFRSVVEEVYAVLDRGVRVNGLDADKADGAVVLRGEYV